MTMLTVGSQGVAELELKNVSLHPLLGAYEIWFGLIGNAFSTVSEAYWFTISGAHVTISSAGGHKKRLGIAHAYQLIRTHAGNYGAPVSVQLQLTIQPHQVADIEDFCHEQDMTFELSVIGEGGGGPQGHWHLGETFSKVVPRSVWIEQLRSAGALDILVLEVPMPILDPAPELRKAVDSLRRAQKMFVNGNYPECVAHCRDVMDAMPSDPALVLSPNATLAKLADYNARTNMTKVEREFAITAAVRNYTHLAHHSGDPAGTGTFTRSEAKQMLTLSATLVARTFAA